MPRRKHSKRSKRGFLRLIQCAWEFVPKADVRKVGGDRRGIYVLYERKGFLETARGKRVQRFDVLYVGMADISFRSRLRSHLRSKRKKAWTHFSVYAVWPNITREEIRELEGLFRHIYRYDAKANSLNLQRGFKGMRPARVRRADHWRDRTKPYPYK